MHVTNYMYSATEDANGNADDEVHWAPQIVENVWEALSGELSQTQTEALVCMEQVLKVGHIVLQARA
jgi:hypothetical protein